MTNDIRHLESEAFAAMDQGEYRRAISLWNELIAACPGWEHGYASYHLGNCYVDVGEVNHAITAYSAAVEAAPEDLLFSTTLESVNQARAKGIL